MDQGERMARQEQRLDDLRREFDMHVIEANSRSDRVQELNVAVRLLVDAQKTARREEANQYRRLEVRFQRMTVAIALCGVLLTATMAILGFIFHH